MIFVHNKLYLSVSRMFLRNCYEFLMNLISSIN